MATLKSIQFKRSKIAGAKPTAAQLDEGELAINLRDRTIYTKTDQNQIIDLGFAKGGQVDGDILQNGTFNLNGNMFVYAGKYIEFLPKTAGNGAWANQHLNKAPIFADLSSTTSVSEYHPLIKQRYKDGTFSAGTLVNEGSFKFHYIDETGDSKYWTFNRNGNFIVDSGSIEVRTGNISASGNINSANGIITGPEIVTKNINFSTKTFVANANIGYDWVSLPTWVYNPPADGSDNTTNGLNYLRKLRASSASSIFHEIADCRKGKPQEISWWTGVGPASFQWAFDTSGRITAGKSISVGLPDSGTNGRYPLDSAISIGIAIGDNDTGIKWVRDGVIDLMANGISSATILNNGINSTKKLMVGYSRDSGSTWDFPNNNQAMFTARTDIDGNNNGDGQTHIGYNSNSKMYHYFRGTGRMAVGMAEGLIVEPGILDIKTGSNSVAIRADGTINSTQRISMRTGLFLNGDDNTNALSFKAPSGVDGTKTINWDAGIRNGQNKNTVTLKAWGNSFNAGGGNRETVFEVSDSQGYYFYAQRTNPAVAGGIGPVNFKFNGTVETGHIIGLGDITASGTGSFGGNVTMTNGLFVQGGSSITGQVKIGGTADALRIWNAEYGAIFRRSETALHIIPTNKDAGESGGISNLRPLSIGLDNGMVQMRHSVTIGDNGTGGNMITVDNDSKLVVVTSNSRISPNFRMQIGQASYIDAECTDTVRPAGAGSFASQNNENVRAPFYMNIDRADTGTYVPILKQRYVQGNGCYSLGTLINNGNFRVHYHEGGDNGSSGPQTADFGWEFIKNGDFISPRDLIAGKVRFDRNGNITGGSGNFANLNTTLDRKVTTGWINYVDSGWYKLATVTMPQGVATAQFKITGGSGFNVGIFRQATINEIVLRSGNNTPKGINGVLWQRETDAIKDIAYINISGDEYDVYINCGTYLNRLTIEYSTSENASVVVHGLYGPTQSPIAELPVDSVKGRVFKLLNNSSGVFDAGSSNISTNATFVANTTIGFRHKSNGDESGSAATLFYNDGTTFHILLTDKNTDADKTKASGSYNSLRPFSINIASGKVTISNSMSVSGLSEFYNGLNIKNNGSINFDKSGTNPRNMRIFHAGDASRGNRIEIADDSSYLVYFQRYAAGGIVCSFNNSDMTGVQTLNVETKINTPQIGSFGVNTTNALGGNSIAIGDTDTGIKQSGDGIFDIITNAARRMRFQSGDTYSDMNINAPNVYIRSDIRLKSNFKPIENALDKVEQLDGLIYDKADYIGGEVVHTEAGVIAQSLEKVLPEAIREVDDIKGNKVLTVSTQAQVALLIEAVKTLSAKVKELEAKLN
ncbi:long tail fiber protein [Escherichia phage vB_EcoM_VR20]|uniref:Long tail fiber protein Gp37 n=1 Tax=Escherichia phage vB_EcoM_VR20 TaxID=1567027 RepID=A0A0A7HG91_9CAUD|nr:long tail fiber protein distal subunit [Escherichia phage vB_EcoM_VR20]AIZ02319.1 long tail fiber protein [Escherichia phage vB_EcoM_VR20]